MHDLVRPLSQLGFSPKEAAVYVALLSLGSAAVQAIANKAGVNRVTTYAALDALARRGFVHVREEKGKRLYAAEAPQKLEAVMETAKAEVAGREHVLRGVMPMLAALFNAEGPKPHVRFLEGEEGRETIRRLFLGLKGEFVQMLSFDDVLEQRALRDGSDEHVARLTSNNVSSRIILSMKKPEGKLVPRLPDADVRIVGADLLPFHGEVTVRGSMIFLYAYRPSILSVVITSKDMADTMRALFNLAWRGSKDVSIDAYEK